jgi:hypothetical protein
MGRSSRGFRPIMPRAPGHGPHAGAVARWDVRTDEERGQWELRPLAGVGPLRFGTGLADVAQALGVEPAPVRTAEHWVFHAAGVTVYFGDNDKLYCVAVDALIGPQVTFDGLRLTGQVPSRAEQIVLDHAEVHGAEVRFSHAADVELPGYGLVLRSQRAGDLVLTRPVLLDALEVNSWDGVPGDEWRTF